jgi:hypothetical protein
MLRMVLVLSIALVGLHSPATQGADIGQIKISKGSVSIERGGRALRGDAGTHVQGSDIVRTGGDGSVGITMTDNSLLSAGPNSVLVLDRYEFDSTTNQGHFDASLRQGTLAVVSGRLAKQSPDAMTLRTPSAILGVRGTEFVVTAR